MMNDSGESLDISVDEIPHRKAILDEESVKKFPENIIDHQWLLFSEAAKREVLVNSAMREAILSLIAQPVDQLLPAKFMSLVLKTSQKIDRLTKRHLDQIFQYLNLPVVPEEAFQPDFQHTSFLRDPNHSDYLDKRWGKSLLIQDLKANRFLEGVTIEEKKLAIKKYRIARDIKLIVLSAAFMQEQPEKKDGKQLFKNGIELDTINIKNHQSLFEPINWVKRRIIKDRVYEIEVGGKKYILKERKTSRHTDTKSGGHQSGLLSQQEFEVAKDLTNQEIEAEKIIIEWEKPIASITFPDGFQFVVFEFNNNLISREKTTETIYNLILQNKDQFKKEYQEIATLLKKFSKHKLLKTYRRDLFLGYNLRLSFESYARIKSIFWQHLARKRMNEAMLEHGYANSDFDGYAFEINEKEKSNLYLEIFGMDFEYFYKLSEEDKERIRKNRSSNDTRINFNDFEKQIFYEWWDKRKVTAVEQAAYLAFFEKYQI
jgi:hypothetical protein